MGTGLVAAAAAVILATAAFGVYSLWSNRWSEPMPFQNMGMEKLTSSGDVLLATTSTDGQYVFNVHDEGNGRESLWMFHIATGSDKEILPAAEVRYTGLTFTPDGSYLYFVRIEPQRPNIGVLYQIPVLGGTPRQVSEDVDSAATFSPDGRQFAFVRNSSADANSKLIIANADGSNERVLATLPLPGYADPAWSPDGKQIAAALIEPGGKNPGRIVTLDVNTGKEKTLYATVAQFQKPVWTPDGRDILMVFYGASTKWDGQIGVVDVRGGKFRRITNDLNAYSGRSLAITKDEKQLIVIQYTPETALYVTSSEPNAAAQPEPVDKHEDVDVGWLGGGRLLALDFDGKIATMNSDGSDRVVIFQSNLLILSMSVCGNGEQVLFPTVDPETQAINIYRLDVANRRTTVVTNGNYDYSPACSPDNGFFVYTTLVNGKPLLMRRPLQGGQARQLSDESVYFTAISPDAQQIAAITPQGSGVQTKVVLKVIPSNGGGAVKSFEVEPHIAGHIEYSGDGKSIYYPITEKGVSNLIRQSLDGRPPTRVTNFRELVAYGYAHDWLSRKLAIIRGRLRSDIVVVRQQQAAK